jgi:predicted transcriptional regulator
MPCIDSDGHLTQMSRRILDALRSPASLEEVSQSTGTPLYQVRSSVRGMVQAGLIEEKAGSYVLSGVGRSKLEAPS